MSAAAGNGAELCEKEPFPFWGKTPFSDLLSLLEMLFPFCFPTHLQKLKC